MTEAQQQSLLNVQSNLSTVSMNIEKNMLNKVKNLEKSMKLKITDIEDYTKKLNNVEFADSSIILKKFDSYLLNTGSFPNAEWWNDYMIIGANRIVTDPRGIEENIYLDMNKLIVQNVKTGEIKKISIDLKNNKVFSNVFSGTIFDDFYYIFGNYMNSENINFNITNTNECIILKIDIKGIINTQDNNDIDNKYITIITDELLKKKEVAETLGIYSSRKIGNYIYFWSFSFTENDLPLFIKFNPKNNIISRLGYIDGIIGNFSPFDSGMIAEHTSYNYDKVTVRYYPEPDNFENYNEIETQAAYKIYELDSNHFYGTGGGARGQDANGIFEYVGPKIVRYKITKKGAEFEDSAEEGDIFNSEIHKKIGTITNGLKNKYIKNDAPFTLKRLDNYGRGLLNIESVKQLYYQSPEKRQYWGTVTTDKFSKLYTVIKDGKIRNQLNNGVFVECNLELPKPKSYKWVSEPTFSSVNSASNGFLTNIGASPDSQVTDEQKEIIGENFDALVQNNVILEI